VRISLSLVLAQAIATAGLSTQTSTSLPAAGPTFDVVSIKRNTSGALSGAPPIVRPDGGFRLFNVPVATLISRAYPPSVPIELVGLPEWARTERYDFSATSTLTKATPEDQVAMMRALLADRFKLAAHVEIRDQDVYVLQLARSDAQLGSGISPSQVDCAAFQAARAGTTNPVSPARPDFTVAPPPCTVRTVADAIRNGDRSGDPRSLMGGLLEAETTMDMLAQALRPYAGRMVVNRTGLSGAYHMRMSFDMRFGNSGPGLAPVPDAPPSVFTALREQLGLKLEPAKVARETVIIDHLEHPTED